MADFDPAERLVYRRKVRLCVGRLGISRVKLFVRKKLNLLKLKMCLLSREIGSLGERLGHAYLKVAPLTPSHR